MTANTSSTPRALLREAGESHAQAARDFAAASVALHSLSASAAAAAQVAIDSASNAFIRAEVALNRAADALGEK